MLGHLGRPALKVASGLTHETRRLGQQILASRRFCGVIGQTRCCVAENCLMMHSTWMRTSSTRARAAFGMRQSQRTRSTSANAWHIANRVATLIRGRFMAATLREATPTRHGLLWYLFRMSLRPAAQSSGLARDGQSRGPAANGAVARPLVRGRAAAGSRRSRQAAARAGAKLGTRYGPAGVRPALWTRQFTAGERVCRAASRVTALIKR